MSYHGLGQPMPYPQPIPTAADSPALPATNIIEMATINVNPMLEPATHEIGDRAMMLEMQARSQQMPSQDPAAFQQPSIRTGLFRMEEPVGPASAPVPQGPTGYVPTDEQILQHSILFFQRMFAGEPPHSDLEKVIKWAMANGKAHIVARGESIAQSGGSVPSTMNPATQPGGAITAPGPSAEAPNPSHPVTGESKPTGPIQTFVPETGLHPAQPSGPVQVPYPCPPGMKFDASKCYCPPGVSCRPCVPCVPVPTEQSQGPIGNKDAYVPTGPITQQGNPAYGPITGQQLPTGPIGMQYKQQQQQQQAAAAAAAAAAEQKKSPVVPIAVAAGAALLLARLL